MVTLQENKCALYMTKYGNSVLFFTWLLQIVKPVLRGHLWDKEKVAS